MTPKSTTRTAPSASTATDKDEAKPKRPQRTPEQIVADLEAEIARVRERAAKREAKASPAGQALFAAVKALDKALAVAAEAADTPLQRALEAARAPLSEHMAVLGLRLPAPGQKRGRRAQ